MKHQGSYRFKGDDTMDEKQIEQQPKKKKGFTAYDWYSLLHDLVYILAAITLIFVFCVRLVGVSGESMMPTLHDKDYLALQSNVIMGDLKYGDIIVARDLNFRDGEPIVKRVIATEGQKLEIFRDKDQLIHVFIDGERLDEPYILQDMEPYYFNEDNDGDPNMFSVTVSENCVFAMGDNRNNSSDSRHPDIGEIKIDQVLGKVLLIVLPGTEPGGGRDFSRWGAVN